MTTRSWWRAAPRTLLVAGLAVAAAGLAGLGRIDTTTSFWLHLLPCEVLVGAELGLVFVTVSDLGLVGVAPANAGVAAALVATTQQLGASIGTPLLNAVATTATATALLHDPDAVAAQVGGYRLAFDVSAVALVATAALIVALTHSDKEES